MSTPLNVLLIESGGRLLTLASAALLRLNRPARLSQAGDTDSLRQAMEVGGWDLLLLGGRVGTLSPAQATAIIRGAGCRGPLILCDPDMHPQDMMHLLQSGVDDCLAVLSEAALCLALTRQFRDDPQRRSRAEIEDRLRLLSLAVEESPVSVLITDRAGRIQYANPKFEALSGYSSVDAIGRPLDFTCADHPGGDTPHQLRPVLDAGQDWSGALAGRRIDGSLFWENVHLSPLRNAMGAVTHFVVVKEDISERRLYEDKLLQQANYDTLTGLPNRTLLLDRLDQALAVAHRAHSLTALMFLDLDHFKTVNDTLGHGAGDRLLTEASGRLQGCLREGDTLARMGGDEFVVVLPGILNAGIAERVAQRIIAAFTRPFTLSGQEHVIGTSIGIALYPRDGDDRQTLLRHADLAMYQAKEMGRGRYHLFTAEINERMRDRVALENQLRGAVARNELALHYQPILRLSDGALAGVEALLRWRRADGEFCLPSLFIPVAEEIGLINEMGLWALETALAEISAAFPASARPARLAVNVSPRQLQDADFAGQVEAALQRHGWEPQTLELEITENVLMDDGEAVADNLRRLCALGVRLSIDDFGTGYSSLGYLQRYPFTTLKIDRSFVTDAAASAQTGRLVDTIITMGHGLGLELVAEGVETDAQLVFLRERQCDTVQGYYFSPPLPAAALPSRVSALRAGIRPRQEGR